MSHDKLHFDFRDIFLAPRLALSGKKIWIFLKYNMIGYIVFSFLNYSGLLLSGQSLKDIWSSQGLYPSVYNIDPPWYAILLFWVGVIYWVESIFFASTAVSRVTYKQIKGNEFYSARDSKLFVKKHWHAIVFSPIAITLILLFFFSIATIFALIGKIPYLGELFFSITYLIYFFGSLLTIFTIIVLIISIMYQASIIGVLEEDTMGTVFNSYSIAWNQPLRVFVYHLILIPLSYLAIQIFTWFLYGSFKLINLVFGHEFLMGSKLNKIVGTASSYVWPEDIGIYLNGDNFSLFYNFSTVANQSFSLNGIECFATIFVGLFLFIITFSILSYYFAIFSVGETLMLSIFKQKTDSYNILKRKDEEDLEQKSSDYNKNRP
tara:strand:+ start:608 stop:1738 length:1131 start_codon:yes stop_codon:yes gene_type:complete